MQEKNRCVQNFTQHKSFCHYLGTLPARMLKFMLANITTEMYRKVEKTVNLIFDTLRNEAKLRK